jgi:hypothetical protein
MDTHLSFDSSQQFTQQGVGNRDRRRNGRIYYSASAVIESLDSTPLNSAMVINYSNGGLCFESDALITPGTIIYLGISDSPYSQAATTYECHRVKVMWCKDLYRSDYKYGYGVRHLDPIDAYTDDTGEHLYDIPQYLKMVIADKKDCRKHPRKTVSSKAFFTSANQFHEGTITNVSKGGFFIATPDNFVAGQTINLVVPGTKFDRGVMIKAEIVRTTAAGIGIKIVGLIKSMA